IVDEHYRRAELAGDHLDGGVDSVLVRDVHRDRDRAVTGVSQVVDGRGQGGLVQVQRGDGKAVRGQPTGDLGADAPRRSGDDGRARLRCHGWVLLRVRG